MTNEALVELARAALHEVPDPETGINIMDLGLVYAIEADAAAHAVNLTITFTSPACPAGDAIVGGIERRLQREEAIENVDVTLSFEPRWTPERISPEGRASLGLDD